MLRAYIVDDEKLAVQRLTRMLEASGRVAIAGSTTDPEAALAFLNVHRVDVLFLDIQMPGLTGFDLLARLTTDPLVVFTTAYDQYALNAFDVNSIDYLLKPIEPERLGRTLDKIEKMGTGLGQLGTGLGAGPGRDPSPIPDVRALARALAGELSPHRRLERIASRVGERTTVLDVARISHFTAKDKLTFAVVSGHEHVIDYVLAQLETDLDARRFIRIHRSTVVNIAYVQELFPAVDGGVLVRLKDEPKTELSVARDRVRALKEKLGI
jgi:two-component system LytT family response regulator